MTNCVLNRQMTRKEHAVTDINTPSRKSRLKNGWFPGTYRFSPDDDAFIERYRARWGYTRNRVVIEAIRLLRRVVEGTDNAATGL